MACAAQRESNQEGSVPKPKNESVICPSPSRDGKEGKERIESDARKA